MSGLKVVLMAVLTRRFVEKGVVIEASSLTEGRARERHQRCSLAVVVQYQPCCSVFVRFVLRYTMCTLLTTPRRLLSSLWTST